MWTLRCLHPVPGGYLLAGIISEVGPDDWAKRYNMRWKFPEAQSCASYSG